MSAARLIRLEQVASTMPEAHLLAAAGEPHGSAVVAREQIGGYGSRGRNWASPVGGLWLSVILRPGESSKADGLSVRVGLAVAAVLEREVPRLVVGLKWPNDLLVDGRKLGGVLCEARWQAERLAWAVVGIGLNVSNPIPPEYAITAVALREISAEIDPADLAGPVARAVAQACAAGGPLTPGELRAFAARDTLRGQEVSVDGIQGVAVGLSAEGALELDTADGRHAVLRPPAPAFLPTGSPTAPFPSPGSKVLRPES